MHGTVQLPALGETPQILRDLLSGESAASKRFLENTRRYNSVFQMASTGWPLCFTAFTASIVNHVDDVTHNIWFLKALTCNLALLCIVAC